MGANAPPPALVDIDRLTRWLDDEGLAADEPLGLEPLTGGTSNAMFLLTRGDRSWVLRRPAAVAVPRADEVMRREFRFLRALEGTAVPHPAPVAFCDDDSVIGRPFYLAEQVHGVHPFPAPPPFDEDDDGRAEIAFALVDALAHLHEVDWHAAGIGDLGRPDGFHERQVERWRTQLASYGGRQLPGVDQVTTWLDAHRPTAFEPTIMHGDYHMMNVLISTTRPARVVAVLDWETATIGDPLLDLAGFCEIWCSVATEGWPTKNELLDRYVATRGLGRLGDLTYYETLYNFRLAVLMEGIYQRSLLDPTRPNQDDLAERASANMDRAIALVAGG